jgi:probable F420-dependent oxidoreductase
MVRGGRVMKIRFAVAPQSSSHSVADVLAFADALEASGFDGVWLSDLPLAPVLDPLIGLALIAGRTSRLRLGANVVPLGRNPFLLAKGLAQLDQLSSGRLLLSFVPGLDQPGEREALGLGGANRGAVLEEVLGLVRSWWAGAEVEHHSTRWSFTALAPAARPVQDPLEVWLGGRGPKALDRVGRIADGWLGAMLTPEEARIARERIQAAAARAGREIDPEHFGLSIAYARTPPEAALLQALAARRADIDPRALLPVGEQELRSFIKGYVAAGLSKFVVRPAAPVRSWQDEVEWLAGVILDLQT